MPKSIIHKVDQRRGDIPRSRFIRRAIERYLGSNSSSKDIDKVAAVPPKQGGNKENDAH